MILEKRACKIGGSINARTEMHGEEPCPAMDITITALITQDELNDITGESLTSEAWFDQGGTKLAQPLLKGWKPYQWKAKFEESSVTLYVGLQLEQIAFNVNVTVGGMVFEPQVGGMIAIKLKFSTPITPQNSAVFMWMKREADIEIALGKIKLEDLQSELDLKVEKLKDEDASEPSDDLPKHPEELFEKPRSRARRSTRTGDAVN